ncbi:MAG: hypothetical protein M3125_05495 [Gemmatimonadota bacterium]|nr:hypothetical protein [Gemmatimonadota bacterium]
MNPYSMRIVAVTALAVALGCAPNVTLTPLGTEQAYPPTPESVSIPLYATTKPECPYDEIAAITAEGRVYHSDEKEVLEALIAKARAVGAHAIVGYTQGTRAASAGSETGDVHVRNGTAIRFRNPDCMK